MKDQKTGVEAQGAETQSQVRKLTYKELREAVSRDVRTVGAILSIIIEQPEILMAQDGVKQDKQKLLLELRSLRALIKEYDSPIMLDAMAVHMEALQDNYFIDKKPA